MAYTKQTWQDSSGAHPVSAARMGVIETGIFDAHALAGVALGYRPESYGAVGDGTTNDTTAINSAITAAGTRGTLLLTGIYKITSTIAITCNVLSLGGEIRSYCTTPDVALQIGSETTDTFAKRFVLPRVTEWGTGAFGVPWPTDITGVRVVNVQSSYFEIPYIDYFTVGMEVTGKTGMGSVHNTFVIGFLYDNKVNHQMGQLNATGWANSNVFIGGNYQFESSRAPGLAGTRHVLLKDVATPAYSVNGNSWYGSSLEQDPEFNIECWGEHNAWYSPRFEGVANPPIAWRANTPNNVYGRKNLIHFGLGTENLAVTADANTSDNVIEIAKVTSAYTVTNATTDRAYDANAYTTDELADVLGTLITDLKAKRVIS